MTPLAKHLAARIAAHGPMTLADYMSDCLLHPTHGYYATRDPLGVAGDFTTAPEISQMFGELLGLALAQAWIDQGRPANALLAELGPGRGTLMSDIRRAGAQVPGFAELPVHLVEASPVLRAAQAQAVPGAVFHADISTLPDGPLFLVANEFFDALPIRQFQRDPAGWREVMVGLGDNGLTPGLSDPAPMAALDHRLDDTRPGDIVEVNGAAEGIATVLGARIDTAGGAALIIDYGDWRSLGDTFQALRGHQCVDPYAEPGQADLTAHVDFEALARAASPAVSSRLTAQGVFLERLGITARAQALAARLDGAALETHIAAHRRLTHADEMGTLFKVMGLRPRDAAPLPGLNE